MTVLQKIMKEMKSTYEIVVLRMVIYKKVTNEYEKNNIWLFFFRSIKLKKVVGPQKKEVLVQTGAGFFRFEGKTFNILHIKIYIHK